MTAEFSLFAEASVGVMKHFYGKLIAPCLDGMLIGMVSSMYVRVQYITNTFSHSLL